jgi:hypothetical protein
MRQFACSFLYSDVQFILGLQRVLTETQINSPFFFFIRRSRSLTSFLAVTLPISFRYFSTWSCGHQGWGRARPINSPLEYPVRFSKARFTYLIVPSMLITSMGLGASRNNVVLKASLAFKASTVFLCLVMSCRCTVIPTEQE